MMQGGFGLVVKSKSPQFHEFYGRVEKWSVYALHRDAFCHPKLKKNEDIKELP